MAEHVVPPGVQVLLEIVVGNQWPEGNEGDLRILAADWRAAGKLVNGLVEGTRTATAHVDAALQAGTARGAIDTVLHGLTEGDQAYLPTLAAVCTSLGDALDGMALEIETLRIEIIAQLVVLAAEIAIDLALAPFTFGASESAAAAQIAAARITCTMLIRKAVIKLIAHLAESEFNQVGLDFFAQFIEICQHRRSGFDTGELRIAATNGAVGGTVGFGMGGLGALFKKGIGRAAGDHRLGLGAGVLFDGGWGAASGAAEASAQDAALGGSGDTATGAMNGAFSGFKGAGHNILNPHNKVPLTAGHYFESGLNHGWDHAFPGSVQPPNQPHTLVEVGGNPIVTAFPDGSHVVAYPDGTNVSTHPDDAGGTAHVVHYPDGSTVTMLPDGNSVITLPDGSTRIVGPDQPDPQAATVAILLGTD